MLTLPDYTLDQVLFDGPDITIYRGRRRDGLPVAIKTPRSEHPSPRQLAMLRHEHLLTRDLDVPGVVRSYGLEKVGWSAALILEDFGGRPLSDLRLEGSLDLKRALGIAISIAETLGEIHGRRVIHKDIKPQNILVNPDTGWVKLTDFGIAARLSEEMQQALSPDLLEGTLAYMSPEQTGRMARPLDNRTDFYSFGVTLYELFTGALPFSSEDPMELVHSHIARIPVPPHERSPAVPEALSKIVMKLLAKDAEDRYQGALGVKADLHECLARLSARGSIAPFPLGRHDVASTLRTPHTLYGREAETAELLRAFERCRRRELELMLIAGYAGVGKSALVASIHRDIALGGGYFTTGKSNQLGLNAPYAIVVEALRQLLRRILTEPESAVARWRSELSAAVSPNGRLLIELIPELEQLIGPQPAVPELGPTESQNRFDLLFQSFLRAFSKAEHPLVLFLDDLQWADPASLRVLELLSADPEGGHLFIIGAYRDHEVGPGNPFGLALAGLREARARVTEITLKPLKLTDAAQFVADTLGCEKTAVAPLSALAFEKTDGNPFFLGQFLRGLATEGLLHFNVEKGTWSWDIERIRATAATENVVDFMTRKVRRLRPEAQRVLRLAACIGHTFDLDTLTAVSGLRRAGTAAQLWEALREGLVTPLSAEYKLVAGAAGEEAEEPTPHEAFRVDYKFVHDRVQQAAYSMIDEADRPRIHLDVGRLLLSQGGADARGERLFEIVDHLNMGAPLIEDPAERLDLARSNCFAGTRAKTGTAYEAAIKYLRRGAALIGEDGWGAHYELLFALNKELAECEYLIGNHERALALFHDLVGRARSNMDRAQIYSLLVVLHHMGIRIADALEAGRSGLALFGISMPETEEQAMAAMGAGLDEVAKAMAGRRIESLIDAPALTDPARLIQLKILGRMVAPATATGPGTLIWVVLKMVAFSLEHGHADVSCHAYAVYGYILCGAFGRYAEARALAKLAVTLVEKLGSPEVRCKVYLTLGCFDHFFEPAAKVVEHFVRARRAGIESGDLVFGCASGGQIGEIRLRSGDELSSVRAGLEADLAVARRAKDSVSSAHMTLSLRMIASLEGRTEHLGSISDGSFNEEEWLAELKRGGGRILVPYYYTAKLTLAVLHEDYAGAMAAADLAEENIGASAGIYFSNEIPFYGGIAAAALMSTAEGPEKERYAARLSAWRAKTAVLAELCPLAHRPKHLLLSAEAARVEGRHGEARELYDEAIDAAREGQTMSHWALANEFCAKYYLNRGKEGIAREYLTAARQGYFRWGATAKTRDLVKRYGFLIMGARGAGEAAGLHPTITATTSFSPSITLDRAALLKAAEVIAGEISLDKLVQRVMRLAVESGGATRGVLILSRDGELKVEAAEAVDAVDTADSEIDFPETIVQLVARTGSPVVLDDAAGDPGFGADPYLKSRRTKSILCLAMTHQGRLSGVLYLENSASAGAFTPARVDLCGFIAAQAAISIENALLIADIRRRSEALTEANERLERELLERRQAEEAQAELRRELLRVQTPLIPITDQVMVMPIIGAVDEPRARQILETALAGVHSSRAKVVILDITGVEVINASVMDSLVGTARALALLGAQAVITGMRPLVARQLVELGSDFASILTLRTLEDGIHFALRKRAARG
ncbi:MAG: AAA family ATPase [Polyangiaceae bacterium]|nr:AAA family ATPase [Polyangiaceae bacterium]